MWFDQRLQILPKERKNREIKELRRGKNLINKILCD